VLPAEVHEPLRRVLGLRGDPAPFEWAKHTLAANTRGFDRAAALGYMESLPADVALRGARAWLRHADGRGQAARKILATHAEPEDTVAIRHALDAIDDDYYAICDLVEALATSEPSEPSTLHSHPPPLPACTNSPTTPTRSSRYAMLQAPGSATGTVDDDPEVDRVPVETRVPNPSDGVSASTCRIRHQPLRDSRPGTGCPSMTTIWGRSLTQTWL
jgi:hypothetical protein